MPPRKPSPVGAHVPSGSGLARAALPYARRINAQAVQIFAGNPRGWALSAGDPEQDTGFREAGFDGCAAAEDRFGRGRVGVQVFAAVDGGAAQDDGVAVGIDAQQVGRGAGVLGEELGDSWIGEDDVLAADRAEATVVAQSGGASACREASIPEVMRTP